MAIVERMDHESGRSRKYKVKATPRVAARRVADRARRVTDDRVTVAKVEDGLEVRGKYPPGQYDGTDGKYVIAIVRA